MNKNDEKVLNLIKNCIAGNKVNLYSDSLPVEFEGIKGKLNSWSGLINKGVSVKGVRGSNNSWLSFGGYAGYGFPTLYLSYHGTEDVYINDEKNLSSLLQMYFYDGVRKKRLEISQEFSKFYNLYKNNNDYYQIDINGDLIPVMEFHDDKVVASKRFVSRYTNATKRRFFYFFSIDFDNELTVDESQFSSEKFYYFLWNQGRGTLKANISGYIELKMDFNKKIEDIFAEKKHLDFIVDRDEYDQDILHTCDPYKLNSFHFGEKSKYHDLTKVIFKSEVLNKYLNDKRYTISSNALTYGNIWSLRMDNLNDKYVVVLLCDLSSLPYKHQLYWKSYNFYEPSFGMSKATFNAWFLNQWITDEEIDSITYNLKANYRKFVEKSEIYFKSNLFKEILKEDDYRFEDIRLHFDMQQNDFDSIINSMSTLFVERLDEKIIDQKLNEYKIDLKNGLGSVKKFHELMKYLFSIEEYCPIFEVLAWRNKSANHLKGSDYLKLMDDSKGMSLEEILTDLMKRLSQYFYEINRCIL